MLNIRVLNFDRESNTVMFLRDVDLKEVRMWGNKPMQQPIKVEATLKKNIDGYLLNYTVNFSYVVPCARCLTQVVREVSSSYTHLLKEDDGGENLDDWVTINRDNLKLTELVTEDILLNFPDVTLCRKDCQGLCIICGGNRNENNCNCKTKATTDPRFDVLRELLGNDD